MNRATRPIVIVGVIAFLASVVVWKVIDRPPSSPTAAIATPPLRHTADGARLAYRRRA